MLEDPLVFQIEQSPAIALLRSDHASFIIGFFQSIFGATQRLQIGYTELTSALSSYNDAHGQILSRRANDYIDTWADEKHRFLRKYYVVENDEPQVELSYEVASMMSWLQSQGNQAFVGTESRVSALFQMISQLASYSDTDPKERIAMLKKERQTIDEEIQHIKKTGTVPGWDDLKKREYLSHIMEDSRRLFADFALIEDIFKEHARLLKEKMVSEQCAKGEILAHVLDMHDALDESDQGKSFRAFWDFLISPLKQEELTHGLEKILTDLVEKPYLKGMQHREYVTRLKGFKSDLLKRGRKVLSSQNRLTREIRTLLVQQSKQDRQAIHDNMAAIKAMCLQHKTDFADMAHHTLVHIEHKPKVHLPLERPLWSRPMGMVFDLGENIFKDEMVAEPFELNASRAVPLWQLEERLKTELKQRSPLPIETVMTTCGTEGGLEELTAYLSIAMKYPEHEINTQKPITLLGYIAPHILFHREAFETHLDLTPHIGEQIDV